MTDLETAALRYAGAGWPVFPTHWPNIDTDGVLTCSCGQNCDSTGKHPLTKHGFTEATTNATTITRWWRRQPQANIAVRTGAPSGIVVVDLDGDEGLESWRRLERDHGSTLTGSIVTPRGGQHLYFRHPGVHVPLSVGKLGAGIDVRADGGYVLVPPSLGATGRRYEPDERRSLTAMPEWLIAATSAETAAQKRATPSSEWLRIVNGVDEGSRNHELTRLCGHLLRRYIDVDLAAELVHLVNDRCKPPLDRAEVDQIIDSIASRELRRRERRAA